MSPLSEGEQGQGGVSALRAYLDLRCGTRHLAPIVLIMVDAGLLVPEYVV